MKKVRSIGISERPWALPRNLQSFLGRFVLDADTGIYFQEGTQEEHIAQIKAALSGVPRILLDNALSLGLTMSATTGPTRNGNSSTTYADFGRSRNYISPHIEVGGRSLNGPLDAHLIHEFSHLFFDSRPDEVQDLWIELLLKTARRSTIEVTDYAHDCFKEWLGSKRIPKHETYRKNHLNAYLRIWSKEAFCESAAVLCVPTYMRSDCTVDMTERCRTIAAMGLSLPQPRPGARKSA